MPTIFLPVNHTLTITPSATLDGHYVRKGEPGGTVYTPVFFSAAASAIVLGPFDENRNYEANNGTLSVSDAYASSASDNAAIALKANIASPTFTGTVVLPATTSIGTVTNTEIGYLDNVTSAIQTQLNAKQASFTPVAFQADLAIDADGTAIAASVNALKDALVTLGLMQPEA